MTSSPTRLAATLVAVAVALTLLLPGRRPPGVPATQDAARGRVGLVFDVGGRGDRSFNDAAYEGLMRASRELGAEVEVLEPGGSEDREAAMRLFAARGFDLVVGVGFIFSSDVDRVARDFPGVRFACVDYGSPGGGGPPPNVAALVFHDEQGAFLVGAVAGLATHTRRVGFVGGMPIPVVRNFEVGYEAGVHAVCPDCAVQAAYAGSSPEAFRDPARGKAVALAEIGAGADVVFHAAGGTGHGVLQAAHDTGTLAIGVDSDQYDEMPDAVLTSMLKRADVAVYDTIADALGGRFTGGYHVFGVKDGALDFVHEGPHASRLPPPVISRVLALRDGIASGAIVVPTAR